jgi:hypothetical protein
VSNITRIASSSTTRRKTAVDGPDVPKLQIDPRFGRAFPEQAEFLRKFSQDLVLWWRNTKIESPE